MRPVRIGEEKKKKDETTAAKYNGLWPAPLGGHKQCISLSVVTMMARWQAELRQDGHEKCTDNNDWTWEWEGKTRWPHPFFIYRHLTKRWCQYYCRNTNVITIVIITWCRCLGCSRCGISGVWSTIHGHCIWICLICYEWWITRLIHNTYTHICTGSTVALCNSWYL